MRIAFLGLGQMGLPMAERLVSAGNTLRVWNRTSDKAQPLTGRATLCATPEEAATGSEVVITMLSTPQALEAVVLGPHGAAPGLSPDAALVEMSTMGPDAIRGLAAKLPGQPMLDAPVLGSTPQATDGTLKIFVGGEASLFQKLAPLLSAMGAPRHVGPLGAGASLKLVVNSTLGTLMGALGEALALGDGLGLDLATVLDVLADSPISTPVRSKRALIESGKYPPRFKLDLAEKDLKLVLEAAKGAGVEMKLAATAREWISLAAQSGLGSLDYSAVVAHIRRKPASN